MNKKVKSLLYFSGFVIAALIHYQVTHHDLTDLKQWVDGTTENVISENAIN